MSGDCCDTQKKKYGADPYVQAQMGALLRQVYGSVIEESVPDRFSKLLEKLAAGQPETTPEVSDDLAAERAVEPGDEK